MSEMGRDRQHEGRPAGGLALMASIVVGLGLFRGVNANLYLSAFASVEEPFLFVPDLFFNVVVACAVVVSAGSVVALTLAGRLRSFSMPYVLPTGLLLIGNVAALAGAFCALPADFALLVPGILFGASSVMLSLFWVEVLAAERPSTIATQIALSMLIDIAVSSMLSACPPRWQMVASCILLVAMAACACFVRKRLPEAAVAWAEPPAEQASRLETRPGLQRAPRSQPLVLPAVRPARHSYRDAFLELGDSLVAFFVLEAVIGLLNSFMIAGSIEFAGSDTASTAGMLGAIAAFALVAFVVQRLPKASTAFRVVMPIIAAMLVFLPFLSETYNFVFSVLLLGSYYFVALLITYLVAKIAHVRRVSPYVLMGAAMGIARICLAFALLAGYAAGTAPGGLFGEAEHTMRYLVIIVVVLYALCMALVFFSRDRRRRRRDTDGREPVGGGAAGSGAAGGAPGGEAAGDGVSLTVGDGASSRKAKGEGEAAVAGPGGRDAAFDACCAHLADEAGLTEREAEIMRYLARGHRNAHIAKTLFVSENTVRSHVRSIYAKLDVHTRQELIDLVDQSRAR